MDDEIRFDATARPGALGPLTEADYVPPQHETTEETATEPIPQQEADQPGTPSQVTPDRKAEVADLEEHLNDAHDSWNSKDGATWQRNLACRLHAMGYRKVAAAVDPASYFNGY